MKTKDPIFYNADGTLTKYALSCGYAEWTENQEDKNLRVTLYIEHGHIHVKSYSLNVWEVLNSNQLTKAKLIYNKLRAAVIVKDYDFKLIGITQ